MTRTAWNTAYYTPPAMRAKPKAAPTPMPKRLPSGESHHLVYALLLEGNRSTVDVAKHLSRNYSYVGRLLRDLQAEGYAQCVAMTPDTCSWYEWRAVE